MNKNIVIAILVIIILAGGYFVLHSKTTVLKTQPTATVPGSTDCGTDMNCFVAQANTCGPATVTDSMSIAGGSTVSANLAMSKTATPNSCLFTDTAYGRKQVCTIPSNKLVAIMTDWKAGTFDSSAFDPYSCVFSDVQ